MPALGAMRTKCRIDERHRQALVLLPFALWAGPWWPATLHDWLWLLALAGISHILGQGLIAYALAHLSSAFSSVSLLVQPVAAAAFAWVLLAEYISLWQGLGALVVLLGIVMCRGSNRAEPQPVAV